MRIPTPVYVSAVLASAIFSTILWRDLQAERGALQAERQLSAMLRTQLAEARTERTPDLPIQSTADPASQLSKNSKLSSDLVAKVADDAKRQQALLENSEYHKARLAEVRATLKKRNPFLAKELGISEREADAVFDILAESQLRKDAQTLNLAANGTPLDAAATAELKRQQQAQQQEDKDALVSMLGTSRYEQLEDIEQTQPARVRVDNLSTLMAQSGQALTNDQALALTKVMVEEEKREEKESQELRASGQSSQASSVDRAVEGDRRILDGAAGILSAQQLETMRVRFEQRQAMERASGTVQAREHGAN